ncbi:hypothetical protein SBOR_5524 [Sclerotinia borealis F-4128]|uniref:Uncharacterized protein n=1 Tax=Sclerotinia borealis (strain F-4128) TaxID=1432307 RepID=W9CH81_SCLBF|nr:hypothetical protein SBOR_5524 [Sclerotinia borealis F-4128]
MTTFLFWTPTTPARLCEYLADFPALHRRTQRLEASPSRNPTYAYVDSIILAVSSRVFVDLPLARDKARLDIISAYIAEAVATGDALRPYPHFLRPLFRPFLAPQSRMAAILSIAQIILGSAILERQDPNHKANDLLGFLIATSKNVH